MPPSRLLSPFPSPTPGHKLLVGGSWRSMLEGGLLVARDFCWEGRVSFSVLDSLSVSLNLPVMSLSLTLRSPLPVVWGGVGELRVRELLLPVVSLSVRGSTMGLRGTGERGATILLASAESPVGEKGGRLGPLYSFYNLACRHHRAMTHVVVSDGVVGCEGGGNRGGVFFLLLSSPPCLMVVPLLGTADCSCHHGYYFSLLVQQSYGWCFVEACWWREKLSSSLIRRLLSILLQSAVPHNFPCWRNKAMNLLSSPVCCSP
jgi:hypothetical protein